jgi:hypothetical protein
MREKHIIDDYVFLTANITSQTIRISRALVFYVSVLPFALNIFRFFVIYRFLVFFTKFEKGSV